MVAGAKLVLGSSEGETNSRIATRLRWTKATVGKWRQRFIQHRLAGLYDELRPGRPRTIEDEQIAALGPAKTHRYLTNGKSVGVACGILSILVYQSQAVNANEG